MDIPFIKFQKSKETWELLMDTTAFTLLAVIAYRAKRTNEFSIKDLQIGEALLGDYRNYGMSEQQYRSAKSRLQKYGFATFRTTPKGTIATLSNTIIYDINAEPSNGQINSQATDDQRTTNGQTTTNKNDKNVNNVKNDNKDKYLDFVFLSKEEYEKLKTSFGEQLLKERIASLNDAIGSKGYRYKSHYFTILNWARRDGIIKVDGNPKNPERNYKKEYLEQREKNDSLESNTTVAV